MNQWLQSIASAEKAPEVPTASKKWVPAAAIGAAGLAAIPFFLGGSTRQRKQRQVCKKKYTKKRVKKHTKKHTKKRVKKHTKKRTEKRVKKHTKKRVKKHTKKRVKKRVKKHTKKIHM